MIKEDAGGQYKQYGYDNNGNQRYWLHSTERPSTGDECNCQDDASPDNLLSSAKYLK